MPNTIALIAPGAMGSAVGQRLHDDGHVVTTWLDGRSAASRARAEAAGMAPVPLARIAEADFILSILPPSEALSLATSLAPAITAATVKPVYVDCNAISPATMEAVAAIVSAAGASVVDAGIIGGPPKPKGKGPAIYASGPAAARFAAIETSLDLRLLDGPIGAASSLKICYAGLNKGIITLGSVILLAAARAGSADALLKQLGESNPALLASLREQIPSMYAKAYRFEGEMEEIAAFLGAGDPGGQRIYEGAALFYERFAADVAGSRIEVGSLENVLLEKIPR
jgi:3-hydroxyisobutyrate dehydrogenase-like beta-hydroxyacid dehydrogenase